MMYNTDQEDLAISKKGLVRSFLSFCALCGLIYFGFNFAQFSQGESVSISESEFEQRTQFPSDFAVSREDIDQDTPDRQSSLFEATAKGDNLYAAGYQHSTSIVCNCSKNPAQPDATNFSHEAEMFLRAYPHATDPLRDRSMILITNATEFQVKQKWMDDGSNSFEKCTNLPPWIKCSYFSSQNSSSLGHADVILFHARFMKNILKSKDVLTNRTSDQKWIFFEPEPPTNTWQRLDKDSVYWKMFNITSTFTMDSDIQYAHHKMTCRQKDDWKPAQVDYAAQKTKMVAWFVSHCVTSSRRELYVEEMQKYINVDIYGSCGNLTKCLRQQYGARNTDECMMRLIDSEYKFYLSFENAFCSEYVTEKFYRAVRFLNVVPVVMGAVDYANIFPKGAYIDVDDFNSVEELTDHLKALANDKQKYNAMINMKNAYVCRPPQIPYPCSLCEFLHKHRHERQYLYDAAEFWSPRRRCLSPKDVFKRYAPSIVPRIKFSSHPDLFL